jgi:hypothetical protein
VRPARSILLLAALLAWSSQVHAAEGVSLRWNTCLIDGGVQNKSFACDVNAGAELLAGSFKLGADLGFVSGNEIVVDLATAGAALPAWWQFKNVGTCRQGALGINFTPNALELNCPDWGAGLIVGAITAYNIGIKGPTTARIVAASAVSPDARQDLIAGQEYLSFNLVISHAKTVGTGSCDGCSTPACIVFLAVKVTTPTPANDRTISGPMNGTDSNWTTWQGGGGIGDSEGGCPRPLPTEKRTWGAVKALYH